MTLKVIDHHHSKSRPLLSNSPLILLSNSNFSTSTPITTTNQPIYNSHCILNQKRVNDLPSTTTKNNQLYSTLSNQNPFFIKPTNGNTFTQQLSYYYPIIGLPNWNQSNANAIPNGLKKRFIPHLIPTTISMNSLNMFPTSSNQSIHNYLDLNSIPSYTNPSSFLTSQEEYDLSQFNQSYQSSPRPKTNDISVVNDEINFNEIKVTNQSQYSTPVKHQIDLNEEFLANLNQLVFEAQQLDPTQNDYNQSLYDQSSFNQSDLINNSSYLTTLYDEQLLQEEEEERYSNKRSFEETHEQVNQSPTLKIKKIKYNNYQTENEIQQTENDNLSLTLQQNLNEFNFLTQEKFNSTFSNFLTIPNQRPTTSSSIHSTNSSISSSQFNQHYTPSFEDFDSQFGLKSILDFNQFLSIHPSTNLFHSTNPNQNHNLGKPPITKGFICPKCNKSHSRQSNLLAHLRDTHSTEKKIQCDIIGCQKAYKRVSECRRHKKDIHGIPLPSEVLGKVKRVRRNFTN